MKTTLFSLLALSTAMIIPMTSTGGNDSGAIAINVGRIEQNDVRALDFSPDNRFLAMRTGPHNIRIWDLKAASEVAQLTLPAGANDGLSTDALQFNPSGSLLVACHGMARNKAVASLWKVQGWTLQNQIFDENPGGGCISGKFTTDGKYWLRIANRFQFQSGSTLFRYRTEDWSIESEIRTHPFRPVTMALKNIGLYTSQSSSSPRNARNVSTAV